MPCAHGANTATTRNVVLRLPWVHTASTPQCQSIAPPRAAITDSRASRGWRCGPRSAARSFRSGSTSGSCATLGRVRIQTVTMSPRGSSAAAGSSAGSPCADTVNGRLQAAPAAGLDTRPATAIRIKMTFNRTPFGHLIGAATESGASEGRRPSCAPAQNGWNPNISSQPRSGQSRRCRPAGRTMACRGRIVL